MSSDITIGRVNLDSTASTGLSVGAAWGQSGNMLNLSGWIQTTTGKADVLRQQLNGLVDSPNEPVVPIRFTGDPTVDGFYTIRSAGVSAQAGLGPDGNYEWSVTAEKVTGWQAPRIEIRSRGTVRTNVHGISSTEVSPSIGIPKAALGWSEYTGRETERIGATSTMRVLFHRDIGTNQQYYHDATPFFYLGSSAYYDGAATITQDGEPVVGRQIRNESTTWEVSNDLVKVTPTTSATLSVSHYSTASTTADGYYTQSLLFGESGSTSVLTQPDKPHAITILRNQPETVSVRLHYVSTYASGPDFPVALDLSLRRGQRWVECSLAGPRLNYSGALAVGSFAISAATTSTAGGFNYNSTSVDYGTPVLASPQGFAVNMVSGLIPMLRSTENPLYFGVNNLANVSSTYDETLAHQLTQYNSAQYERQQIVIQ